MRIARARILAVAVAIGAVVATTVAGGAAIAGDPFGHDSFRERLTGYQEDPATLSTTGVGDFRLSINDRAHTITYRLSYSSLEGNVLQAHIHLGQPAQSGGIIVFLCTNLGNGPAGTQACPAAPATVTGTLAAGDVIGPAAQGITAGQFNELVAAIRAGATYANVHSTLYPSGEIRAQLEDGHH